MVHMQHIQQGLSQMGNLTAFMTTSAVETGEMVETLRHHSGQVYQVRVREGRMVTCSEDGTVAVWEMISPTEIRLRRVLLGHRSSVNSVDFDGPYIVSGDRLGSLKVIRRSGDGEV